MWFLSKFELLHWLQRFKKVHRYHIISKCIYHLQCWIYSIKVQLIVWDFSIRITQQNLFKCDFATHRVFTKIVQFESTNLFLKDSWGNAVFKLCKHTLTLQRCLWLVFGFSARSVSTPQQWHGILPWNWFGSEKKSFALLTRQTYVGVRIRRARCEKMKTLNEWMARVCSENIS